jgi:hypothetical protein
VLGGGRATLAWLRAHVHVDAWLRAHVHVDVVWVCARA